MSPQHDISSWYIGQLISTRMEKLCKATYQNHPAERGSFVGVSGV